jgi:hypothetical protein
MNLEKLYEEFLRASITESILSILISWNEGQDDSTIKIVDII